jgi:hypothetical protein
MVNASHRQIQHGKPSGLLLRPDGFFPKKPPVRLALTTIWSTIKKGLLDTGPFKGRTTRYSNPIDFTI